MGVRTVSQRIFRIKPQSRDNQLLFVTRLLAALIVPVLVIAFVMLYLFPQQSGLLFAWAIKPSMSAMMLGAAYIGGAYYFSRVFVARYWHRVQLGFIPVITFASYLGIATLLHWDRFTAGHPSFIMWAFLYLTLPLILPFVWWLNAQADPKMLEENACYIPQSVERFFFVMGSILLAISLTLLVMPQIIIPIWAWTLTPLTARVMGAMFALPALVGLGIARDKRWSAIRIILQAQVISIFFILLAVFLARTDFNWQHWSAWVFTIGMFSLLMGLIGLYITMQRR